MERQKFTRESPTALLMPSLASATFPKTIETAFVLDFVEKALVAILFIRLAVLLLPVCFHGGDFVAAMILFSEGLAAFLIITHQQTTRVSLGVWDLFVTVVGTVGPLLVTSDSAAPLLSLQMSGVLAIFGLGLQVSGKWALRQSFGLAPANRGVKVGGPYKWVRHPIYVGYAVTQIAFLLSHPSWWNILVYAAAFGAQCWRISAEEKVLFQDRTYVAYMSETPFRILPFIY